MKTPPKTMIVSDETREQLDAIALHLDHLGYEVRNPKNPKVFSLSAVVRILAATEYHARNITTGPSVRIK